MPSLTPSAEPPPSLERSMPTTRTLNSLPAYSLGVLMSSLSVALPICGRMALRISAMVTPKMSTSASSVAQQHLPPFCLALFAALAAVGACALAVFTLAGAFGRFAAGGAGTAAAGRFAAAARRCRGCGSARGRAGGAGLRRGGVAVKIVGFALALGLAEVKALHARTGRGGALPGGGLPLQGQRLALGRGQRGLLRGLVVRQRLGGGGAAHGARGLLRAGGRGLPGAVDGARRGLGRLRGAGVQRAAGVHLALRLVLGDIRRPDAVEAAGAAAAGSRRGAGPGGGLPHTIAGWQQRRSGYCAGRCRPHDTQCAGHRRYSACVARSWVPPFWLGF